MFSILIPVVYIGCFCLIVWAFTRNWYLEKLATTEGDCARHWKRQFDLAEALLRQEKLDAVAFEKAEAAGLRASIAGRDKKLALAADREEDLAKILLEIKRFVNIPNLGDEA